MYLIKFNEVDFETYMENILENCSTREEVEHLIDQITDIAECCGDIKIEHLED